jgi:hypothetical protein
MASYFTRASVKRKHQEVEPEITENDDKDIGMASKKVKLLHDAISSPEKFEKSVLPNIPPEFMDKPSMISLTESLVVTSTSQESSLEMEMDVIVAQTFSKDDKTGSVAAVAAPAVSFNDELYTDNKPIHNYQGKVIGHRAKITPYHPKYVEILSTIDCETFHICDIWEIVNQEINFKYDFKKKEFEHSKIYCNETLLYHATKNITDVVIEGLDPRLSHGGMFGFGTYFTDNLLKANMYNRWFINYNEKKFMILASVLLGNIKDFGICENHPELKRAPLGFNSVKGNITGLNEFVVYDASQIRIDYVISYTTIQNIYEKTLYDSWVSKMLIKNPAFYINPELEAAVKKGIAKSKDSMKEKEEQRFKNSNILNILNF